MLTVNDFKNFDVFCQTKDCGDSVVDRQGNAHYSRRRMNLVEVNEKMKNATYQCPICGKKRKFKIDNWSGIITEESGGFLSIFD